MPKVLTAEGFIGTIISMKYCIECKSPKSYKGEYCKSCSYKHRTRPSGLKYNLVKDNPTSFKKGHTTWNKGTKGLITAWNKGLKGVHLSPSTEFKEGDNANASNPKWKGDKVGYAALHTWVARKKGRTYVCDWCKTESPRTHFANLDMQYSRDLKTWAELCPRCHFDYDLKNGYGVARQIWGND